MPKHPTHEQILAMPLPQQALVLEERRHRARLLELKNMRAALALLDAERPALKAVGFAPWTENISLVHGERMTLSLYTGLSSEELKLCRALLIAGFQYVGRANYDLSSTSFKKGRLTLRVLTTRATLEQALREAASVLPSVQPCARTASIASAHLATPALALSQSVLSDHRSAPQANQRRTPTPPHAALDAAPPLHLYANEDEARQACRAPTAVPAPSNLGP